MKLKLFLLFSVLTLTLTLGCSSVSLTKQDYVSMSDKEVALMLVDIIKASGVVDESEIMLAKFETSLGCGKEVSVSGIFTDMAKELESNGLTREAKAARYFSFGVRAARFPNIIPKNELSRAIRIVLLTKEELKYQNAWYNVAEITWGK